MNTKIMQRCHKRIDVWVEVSTDPSIPFTPAFHIPSYPQGRARSPFDPGHWKAIQTSLIKLYRFIPSPGRTEHIHVQPAGAYIYLASYTTATVILIVILKLLYCQTVHNETGLTFCHRSSYFSCDRYHRSSNPFRQLSHATSRTYEREL